MEYVKVRYALEEKTQYAGIVSLPRYQYEQLKDASDYVIGETLLDYIHRHKDYQSSGCDEVDEFELVEEQK